MVEQNPICFLLLEDGVQRALQVVSLNFNSVRLQSNDPDVVAIVKRFQLVNADSREYMQHLTERPHVIYLDPMYPSKKKMKSLVQKDMQVLRKLAGGECDTRELLRIAKTVAKSSVVLKRPYYFEVDPQCSFYYKSRSTHFDVYKTNIGSNTTQDIPVDAS